MVKVGLEGIQNESFQKQRLFQDQLVQPEGQRDCFLCLGHTVLRNGDLRPWPTSPIIFLWFHCYSSPYPSANICPQSFFYIHSSFPTSLVTSSLPRWVLITHSWLFITQIELLSQAQLFIYFISFYFWRPQPAALGGQRQCQRSNPGLPHVKHALQSSKPPS